MRTYFQVYRNDYFYSYTLDRNEAFRMADELKRSGNSAEVKIQGQTITGVLTCCLRCGAENYLTPKPRPSGLPGTVFDRCDCGGQIVSNPRRA